MKEDKIIYKHAKERERGREANYLLRRGSKTAKHCDMIII